MTGCSLKKLSFKKLWKGMAQPEKFQNKIKLKAAQCCRTWISTGHFLPLEIATDPFKTFV